jgi:hypothetical protein
MAIKKDTLDGLLAGRDPQAIFAKDGLFDELKKALAERVLCGFRRSRPGIPIGSRPPIPI